MSREFNADRAAKCLVDAMLMGDKAAAQKYKVSYKSLQGWRDRLDTDADFRLIFQTLRSEKDKRWADDLPAALASCISFLQSAGTKADPKNPDAIAAIAHAAETLSDIALTQTVVEERLRQAREKA